MASYNVFIKPSATKELEALPVKDRKRVAVRVERLATEPRPPGCKRLSDNEKYRLRQGDFRILCSVDDASSSVLIVKIGGHRRDVYRS